MLIDLHVIQNIAPANLNRDDTGSPKDAIFGGYRRARVSSQAWKRAIRQAFEADGMMPKEQLALRTKRVVNELVTKMDAPGRSEAQRVAVAVAMLGGIGLTADPDSAGEYLTQYLLYIGNDEIAKLAGVADQHWDELAKENPAAGAETGKARKKNSKEAITKDVRDQVLHALDGGRAADLALFGRMLADLPEKNVDGAVQVAHAISTHAVEFEFDYYTAVDDLNTREETGAGMIGTVEFNSATLYRYTNIDLGDLTRNLGDDRELAVKAALAYIRSFLLAIPSGKQSSFAAQNLPSAALAVVREHGRWSLANAFVRPVPTRTEAGLVGTSIAEMVDYYGRLTDMYGDDGIVATPFLVDSGHAHHAPDLTASGNLRQWLDDIETALNSEDVSSAEDAAIDAATSEAVAE